VALVNEKPTLRFAREGAEQFPLSPELYGGGAASDLHSPLRPPVRNVVTSSLEGDKAIPANFPQNLHIEGLGEREGKRFKMTLFKVPAVVDAFARYWA